MRYPSPYLQSPCPQNPSSFIFCHVPGCDPGFIARLWLMLEDLCCILIHELPFSLTFCILMNRRLMPWQTGSERCYWHWHYYCQSSITLCRQEIISYGGLCRCILISSNSIKVMRFKTEVGLTISGSSGSSYMSSILHAKASLCQWSSRLSHERTRQRQQIFCYKWCEGEHSRSISSIVFLVCHAASWDLCFW